MSDQPFLEVIHLVKHFPIFSRGILFKKQIGDIHAVDELSFSVDKGTTFGLVGESGCGKTTTARAILYLDPPTSGHIHIDDEEIVHKRKQPLSRVTRTHPAEQGNYRQHGHESAGEQPLQVINTTDDTHFIAHRA